MPDFNPQPWITLLVSLANLAFMIHVYRAGARKAAVDDMAATLKKIAADAHSGVAATRERLDGVEDEMRRGLGERNEKLNGLHDRISRIENELTHLPSKDQMHTVSIAVASISGNISAITAKLSAVEATAARVENFLLERK